MVAGYRFWLRASTAPSVQALPWILWATMLLLASMEGMRFPATIKSVVALMLLRMCGGFSKLSLIAHTTSPTIATDELGLFDQDVMILPF